MSPLANILNICCRYRFRVEIDGIATSAFREVDGITVSIEVQEYREGNNLASSFGTIPGLAHYGPLVLKRAIAVGGSNCDLWNWIKQIIEGKDQKKNMSIIVMDREGNDKIKCDLVNAWPSSWRLGKLDSHSSSPLVEELTIQYEKISVSCINPKT